MKAAAMRPKYGELVRISEPEFAPEVTRAAKDIWVVLHLYRDGVPDTDAVTQHLRVLAQKFPETKFLRIVSTDCIRNYPDKHLPTILIYLNGELKSQLIGAVALGGHPLRQQGIEWALGKAGAIKTSVKTPAAETSVQRGFVNRSRRDSDE
eukprot:TRINITY_DN930_c0_g1_i3.p2 TRINITY_DN930_c0_g1~~TRINITY_DN930_c0_g1_i3.p2  ORF type:complete len:151 (+),score=32.48 TRINITY_DN930_c0_g1_i3:294-746(+)